MAAGASRGRLRAIALPRVDMRLLAGLALVAVAVVGGLTLWRQAQVTVPVVVAVRDIAPGHVIERADLDVTQARLEGPLAALAIAEAELDGDRRPHRQSASSRRRARAAPRPRERPGDRPDQVAVTVPVQADAVYARMRRGDEVAVMATSDKGKPQSLHGCRCSRGRRSSTSPSSRPASRWAAVAGHRGERAPHQRHAGRSRAPRRNASRTRS